MSVLIKDMDLPIGKPTKITVCPNGQVIKANAVEFEEYESIAFINNDVSPVRHGRWLETEFSMGYKTTCSECNYKASDRYVDDFEYCPRCGAKMDKDIISENEG